MDNIELGEKVWEGYIVYQLSGLTRKVYNLALIFALIHDAKVLE